jgi:hypothetical protein
MAFRLQPLTVMGRYSRLQKIKYENQQRVKTYTRWETWKRYHLLLCFLALHNILSSMVVTKWGVSPRYSLMTTDKPLTEICKLAFLKEWEGICSAAYVTNSSCSMHRVTAHIHNANIYSQWVQVPSHNEIFQWMGRFEFCSWLFKFPP